MCSLFTKTLAVASATLLLSTSNAQTTIPENGTVQYEKKSVPALIIHVDPETKTLKKAWRDYIKDQHDIKLKGIGFLSNKDVLSAEGVTFSAISDKMIDFHTKIIEDENGSEMSVFATFGYDSYISPKESPEAYNHMRSILETFLKSYIPNYYQDLVNDTQKVVDDLTKDHAKLSRQIEKDSQKIEKLTEELEELRNDVEENEAELKETNDKLNGRKEKLKVLQLKLNNVR